MTRQAARTRVKAPEWRREQLSLTSAVDRVLAFPAVADKSFLIHIGDRTVGGLVARDQLVGPWQVPVSDAAVTAAGYEGYTGEAFAMGERTPVAVHDGPASARLAVAEAVLNIAAADVASLSDVRLSANWMAAAGHADDDYALYAMVRAVGEELCPALGIAVPVGKDSLSMRTVWRDGDGRERAVTSPVSLIVSAFAPVADIRRTLTPELEARAGVGAAVRRSRRRRAAARRLFSGADVRPIRRRGARRRRPATLDALVRGAARAPCERSGARVSRPLGRRLVRGTRRDGVRGQRRPRRRRRAWRRRRDRVSLQRGARCRDSGAGRRAAACRDAARRAAAAAPRDCAHREARRHRRAPRRRGAVPRAARRAQAKVVGAHLQDAGAARRSAVRTRGVRCGARRERSRLERRS